MTANIIIILVLILVIVLLVIGFVFYIKRRLEVFSQQFLGTKNILEGFKRQEYEYSNTPKSLSNLESFLLPKIKSDFPYMSIEELRRIAETCIIKVYRSLEQGKVIKCSYFTDEIKEKLENMIRSTKVKISNIKIHRTVVKDYKNSKGRCTITFSSAIEYLKDGFKYQSRVDTFFIYVYDDKGVKDGIGISLNCPNCGAVVSGLGAKCCPYCGSGIVDLVAKTWKFNDLKEN